MKYSSDFIQHPCKSGIPVTVRASLLIFMSQLESELLTEYKIDELPFLLFKYHVSRLFLAWSVFRRFQKKPLVPSSLDSCNILNFYILICFLRLLLLDNCNNLVRTSACQLILRLSKCILVDRETNLCRSMSSVSSSDQVRSIITCFQL